jgi:hypothetical protein
MPALERTLTCTALRAVTITRHRFNPESGASEPEARTSETLQCSLPLLGLREMTTGICRSCAHGREAPGDRFASPAEKRRAMGR